MSSEVRLIIAVGAALLVLAFYFTIILIKKSKGYQLRPYAENLINSIPAVALAIPATFCVFSFSPKDEQTLHKLIFIISVPAVVFSAIFLLYNLVFMYKKELVIKKDTSKYLAIITRYSRTYVDLYEEFGTFTMGKRAICEEYSRSVKNPYSKRNIKAGILPIKTIDLSKTQTPKKSEEFKLS